MSHTSITTNRALLCVNLLKSNQPELPFFIMGHRVTERCRVCDDAAHIMCLSEYADRQTRTYTVHTSTYTQAHTHMYMHANTHPHPMTHTYTYSHLWGKRSVAWGTAGPKLWLKMSGGEKDERGERANG